MAIGNAFTAYNNEGTRELGRRCWGRRDADGLVQISTRVDLFGKTTQLGGSLQGNDATRRLGADGSPSQGKDVGDGFLQRSYRLDESIQVSCGLDELLIPLIWCTLSTRQIVKFQSRSPRNTVTWGMVSF